MNPAVFFVAQLLIGAQRSLPQVVGGTCGEQGGQLDRFAFGFGVFEGAGGDVLVQCSVSITLSGPRQLSWPV